MYCKAEEITERGERLKTFYHVFALVAFALGTGCLFRNDLETFKYSVIIGLLLNILAEVQEK